MPQLKLSGGDTGELSMRKIVIKYRIGSIFEKVPAETLLIHSCNSRGIWGKGVAASFKTRYPTAFETHREYCQQHDAASLIGKPMVIPPNEKNVPPGAQRHHYIGCLFVKDNIGKPRDAAEKKTIVDATKLAMQQLLDGMVEQRRQGLHHIHEIRMPKINSGIFDVDWQETLKILEDLQIPDDVIYDSLRTIIVYTG